MVLDDRLFCFKMGINYREKLFRIMFVKKLRVKNELLNLKKWFERIIKIIIFCLINV